MGYPYAAFNSSTFSRFLAVTRSPYCFLLALSFCIFSYFYIDRQLAVFVHGAVGPQLLQFGQLVTKLGKGTAYFITLPILFVFFQFVIKKPRWAQATLFLFTVIVLSSLICDLMKFVFGRTRPTLFFSEHLYQFTFLKLHADHLSFPSGHSTLISALMLGLCFIFTRQWYIFIVVLLLISSTRILVGAHFLSDVVAGIYLPFLIVPWIYKHWFSVSLQRYSGSALASSSSFLRNQT